MFNQEEITIAQIKDLRLVYIHNCEETLNDFTTPYYGLKIVYGDDKSLSYNYKDKYFNQFLSKVIEVYTKEKELGNVRFLDDNTEKIFKEIDNFPKVKINTEFDKTQNFKMKDFANHRVELGVIKPYLKDLIVRFIYAVNQTEDINVTSFDGINNRYICQYMVDDKFYVIPIFITKSSYDNYEIKFSHTNENSINLSGSINIKPNMVISKWIDDDNVLMGKNIYHINSDYNEKYINLPKGTIYYDNKVLEPSEKDIQTVNKLLELLNMDKQENMTKIMENCYLLTCEKKIDENNDLIQKSSVSITLDSNLGHIIYKKNYGVKKANDQLFISLDEEIIEITLKLIEIDNNSVLIVQRNFIPSMYSCGQYKHDLENKYNYEVYMIDTYDLLEPIHVFDKYDIFDKKLKSSKQIKIHNKVIDRRGDNHGDI